MTTLRIATRKSPLALWQANHIKERLIQLNPGLDVTLLEFTTQGFNRDNFRKMRQSAGQEAGGSGIQVGQRVTHKKFGQGIVINYEGQGEHTRIQVKFDDHGTKWLVATYANLEVI